MEIPNEKYLLPLLKNHGPVALLTYTQCHMDENDTAGVSELVTKWKRTRTTCRFNPNADLRNQFAISAAGHLPKMRLHESKKLKHWSDKEKKDFYAITPSLQFDLKLNPDTRKVIFYDSLVVEDILAGKVLENTAPDEYKIHLLTFCDGRNYHFSDLDLWMYMKKGKCPDVEVGSFIRVAFSSVDIHHRKMYCTVDPTDLKHPITVQLGVIEESELPLCYQASLKEIRPRDSYFAVPENKIPSFKKAMEMLGLENRSYSFQDHTSPVPPAAREVRVQAHVLEKKKAVVACTDEARSFYRKGNVVSALSVLKRALSIDPHNISILLDRAAIYGNIQFYEKAYADLYKCLHLDPFNEIAENYLVDLIMTQAAWYEEQEYYAAALGCCWKLWKVPMFKTNQNLFMKIMNLRAQLDLCEFDDLEVPSAKRSGMTDTPELIPLM